MFNKSDLVFKIGSLLSFLLAGISFIDSKDPKLAPTFFIILSICLIILICFCIYYCLRCLIYNTKCYFQITDAYIFNGNKFLSINLIAFNNCNHNLSISSCLLLDRNITVCEWWASNENNFIKISEGVSHRVHMSFSIEHKDINKIKNIIIEYHFTNNLSSDEIFTKKLTKKEIKILKNVKTIS